MTQVHVGTLERSRILLDVKRREFPSADDFWDGNALFVEVTVEMGSLQGRFGATMRADESELFLTDVRRLQEDPASVAEFTTLEGWLFLRLTGDRLGHSRLEGEATDQPGIGNRLSFRTKDLDQSYLPALVNELEAVLREFPVRPHHPE